MPPKSLYSEQDIGIVVILVLGYNELTCFYLSFKKIKCLKELKIPERSQVGGWETSQGSCCRDLVEPVQWFKQRRGLWEWGKPLISEY